MEATAWDVVLKIASIIGSLATIILGLVAIWLSLYFYRRANEVNTALTQILSRIEASSKTTEVTSTQVTSRLIEGMIGTLQKDALGKGEDPALLRISQKLSHALQPLPKNIRLSTVKEIRDELKDFFTVLRAETAPTTLTYDWGPFIRRIHQLESEHKFLSVKWLNENKFADDPGTREALQVAIKDGIVVLYPIENPKNPTYKTRACKLDQNHPTVKKVLMLN